MTVMMERGQEIRHAAPARRTLRTEHWAAIATIGLLAAHVGLRDFRWMHEWTLSVWQYMFATIMLAPAAAGFGAWKSVSWALASADGAAAAGRQTAVVWRSTWSVCAWILGTFTLGFVGVQVAVLVAGSPGTPAPSDFLPLLSSAAMLIAFTSLGGFVGWRLRSYIAPPVLALICFAGSVAVYTTGVSFLSDTGGATGSLVGLRPNPGRVLLQLVVFALLTALFTVTAGKDPYRTARARASLATLTVVTVGAITLGAAVAPERLLQDPNDQVRCAQADGGPRVCLGPGYSERAGAISAALAAPVAKLHAAGVEFDLGNFDQRPSAAGAHVVNPEMLDRGPLSAAQYVANALMSPSCPLNDDVVAAFSAITWWLAPDVPERDDLAAPDEIPAGLRSSDVAVYGPEVQGLIGVLSGC